MDTQRAKLKAIIVKAIRESPDDIWVDAVVEAVHRTGLRRAIWTALTTRERAELIEAARKVARRG